MIGPMRSGTLVLLGLVACGGKPPEAEAPKAEAASAEGAPKAEEAPKPEPAPAKATTVPTACRQADGVCVPADAAFVKRMCNGSFPDVALVLMAKESPISRMYMKADVDGWNAEGGASARARLLFDEEVLVLKRRAPPAGGVVVGSGGPGWLVMRWDGNCYTLEDNELTAKKPPSPRHPPMPFRFYGDKTKDALLKTPKILAAYQKRGKECKGAVSGAVSKACELADAALSAAIVAEVRGGVSVPTPEKLP